MRLTKNPFVMLLSRYVLLSCLFLLFTAISLFAQDTIKGEPSGPEDPSIVWIGQFPAQNDAKLRPKFGDRLLNFLAGKKYENAVSKPVAVYADTKDLIWILDQGNQSLIRVQEGVGEMPHFRSKKIRSFPSLVGICSFMGDKILFTDSYYNRVFYFTRGKKNLHELNDTMLFHRPTGIAYSSVNKHVWVVETNAHRITVLDENGVLIRRIGGRGISPGEFNFPTSIWIDDSGKVFIVDAMNFRIQVFSAEGELISVFGKQGDATGYFARPKGIATDSEGNIYVVDALFNTVQIFDMDWNFLDNFGYHGRGDGEFWMPNGIFIDEQDHIYVADTYNSRVQVFRFIKGMKQ